MKANLHRVLALAMAATAVRAAQADEKSAPVPLRTIEHFAGVRHVTFSRDGKRVATTGVDKVARIWDRETGKEVLVLSGHTSEVWSVEYSPNGQRIATSS